MKGTCVTENEIRMFDSLRASTRFFVFLATACIGGFFTHTRAYSKPTVSKAQGSRVAIAIVYLGGPAMAQVGDRLVLDLVQHLEKTMGVAHGTLQGAYFTDPKEALPFFETNPDAFILSSLGFYLSHQNMHGTKMLPLARLKLAATNQSMQQEYVVVKKGRYNSLHDLIGKQMHGTVLFEDSRFLSSIVFGNRWNADQFNLRPTQRPLSALRKVAQNKTDAVILDSAQYESLRQLPLHQELKVVFTSQPRPALGLMMLDTTKTRAMKKGFLQAVLDLCNTQKGQTMCNHFGMLGFEPISPGELDVVVKAFETN